MFYVTANFTIADDEQFRYVKSRDFATSANARREMERLPAVAGTPSRHSPPIRFLMLFCIYRLDLNCHIVSSFPASPSTSSHLDWHQFITMAQELAMEFSSARDIPSLTTHFRSMFPHWKHPTPSSPDELRAIITEKVDSMHKPNPNSP